MIEERLLTPGEVARLFRVDPKTVVRWAQAGRFPAGTVLRTLGGHTRLLESGVRKALDSLTEGDGAR